MIIVGIDVAKDKHDCFITSSTGEVIAHPFTIANSLDGYETLMRRIHEATPNLSEVRVGLEATGHYGYNILSFLGKMKLKSYVFNPLLIHQRVKGQSLRMTKTDRLDARSIAVMLTTELNSKPYSLKSYHILELQALCRNRYRLIQQCAKIKQDVSRLVTILFPEIEGLFSNLHLKTVQALFKAFPGASYIAKASVEELTELIRTASKKVYGKQMALCILDLAQKSIGTASLSSSLELQQCIQRIELMTEQIKDIEKGMLEYVEAEKPYCLSIPGISFKLAASIVAEVGDFRRFETADQLLAFAGLSPTTYESGKYRSSNARMEKRGSRYLRYALMTAARMVVMHTETYGQYFAKKRSEGKHYFVALSHVAKRLVRLIYRLEINQETFRLDK